MNLRELPTRFGMLLIVPQSGTEQVLQARVDDLGVPIVRGAEVVGLTQDDDGVTVECADGDSRARQVRGRLRRRAQHRPAVGSESSSSASSTRHTSCWPTCG